MCSVEEAYCACKNSGTFLREDIFIVAAPMSCSQQKKEASNTVSNQKKKVETIS
jgi:hypothetical protein